MDRRPRDGTLALVAGMGIGLTWLALSGIAAFNSFRGWSNQRYDWGLGWALVAVLIGLAGVLAIGGTWWHLNRVLKRHH